MGRALVEELKRIHAEGRAAPVGASNPYHGQRVNAAIWRAGYRRMLDDAIANSPAMQAYLRRGAGRQMAHAQPQCVNHTSSVCLRPRGVIRFLRIFWTPETQRGPDPTWPNSARTQH
jgi:hypothetical protein